MDHKNSQSASYAAAGVDITAGYKAVELMKSHIARTKNEGCLDDVGGFGGCFGLPLAGMEEPGRHGGACPGVRHRWLRHQGQAGSVDG